MPNETNHAHADSVVPFADKAGKNWRQGRTNIKCLVRAVILATKIEGFDLGDLMNSAKKAANYTKMDKQDQQGWRTMSNAVTVISENWADIPQALKDNYISSKEPTYATLVADIKARDKAEKEAAAKAEVETAIADSGLTPDEYQAKQERESDANANVAAIERVIAALQSEGERTELETAAFSRLFEAVEFFTAEATRLVA